VQHVKKHVTQILSVIALNNNKCRPKSLTIYDIFVNDDNWSIYQTLRNPRAVEIKEVNKMLSCGKEFRIYHCPKCNLDYIVCFGCNSRICTHCGKRYTDRWADSVSKSVFDVNHRHFTMSIPSVLWSVFEKNRIILKDYMDIAIKVITKVMTLRLAKYITPGLIVALHTFGKDLCFKPHLHCIVTEGGVNKYGEWINNNYFPYEIFRKKWQYQLLMMLKKKKVISPEMTNMLFKKYENGFYINDSSALYKNKINNFKKQNGKKLFKYIARYFRHPAVAESRLLKYDHKYVSFWYEENSGNKVVKSMIVLDFIKAIVGHIPESQFKTVRHYGLYARNKSNKIKRIISNFIGCVKKTQKKITSYISIRCPKCLNCGTIMTLVFSSREISSDLPPPTYAKLVNLQPYLRFA